MGTVSWVPLLACPAVPAQTLLGKPAVAPASLSVITFENSDKITIEAVRTPHPTWATA